MIASGLNQEKIHLSHLIHVKPVEAEFSGRVKGFAWGTGDGARA